MTKSQLIATVSARVPHVQKKDVEAAVNAVFDSMVEALEREERIEIRGFGSFIVRRRKARDGRNPKTGEQVIVPTRRSPFFAVGKELRERINDREEGLSSDEEAA